MFFKPHNNTLNNFLLYVFPCIFTFSFLFNLGLQSNVFAEMPSVDSSDEGYFSLVYQPCSETTYNGRTYYNCDNARVRDFYRSTITNDDGTKTQIFTYEIPDDLLGSGKYIRIQRLTYTPSSDFVSSGDNVFYSVSSSFSPFLGSARSFFTNDPGYRYTYTMGGFNAYIWSSRWNDMFSCPDQNNDVCQLKFDWDTVTGLGSGFYLSNAFTMPSGWFQFGGIDLLHNLYDNSHESYDWTPYYDNSTLFMLNTWNDIPYDNYGVAYLQFQVQFYKLSEFYDLADTGGANVNDAISAEQGYITNDLNNAGGSNNSLNGLRISNIVLPFSNWFDLFTDQRCATISVIPGWFGLSSQEICSPWPNTIVNVLTPLMSAMSIMLLFGFIIHFLRGGGTPGDDIAYGHGKYKGVH